VTLWTHAHIHPCARAPTSHPRTPMRPHPHPHSPDKNINTFFSQVYRIIYFLDLVSFFFFRFETVYITVSLSLSIFMCCHFQQQIERHHFLFSFQHRFRTMDTRDGTGTKPHTHPLLSTEKKRISKKQGNSSKKKPTSTKKKTTKSEKCKQNIQPALLLTNRTVYPDHPNPLERFPSPIVYEKRLRSLASADNTRFAGLTGTLFHCFYPNASPEQISFVGKQRRTSKRVTGIDDQHPIETVIRAETKGTMMAAKAAALENARSTRAKAMAQGNMVDHQCNAIINNTPVGHTTNLPCRSEQLQARVALLLRFGKNPVDIPVLGIHPLVWNFFFYMDQRGFSPSAAQIGVVDSDVGIATMCDQIWRHRETGYHVMVELKKWETINYEVCIGKMAEPYTQVHNNHKSHHQLQLVFSLAMFEKTFNFRMKAAYVVRLHSSGVCVYPLYPWVLSPQVLTRAMQIIQRFLAPTRETTEGKQERTSVVHHINDIQRRPPSPLVEHSPPEKTMPCAGHQLLLGPPKKRKATNQKHTPSEDLPCNPRRKEANPNSDGCVTPKKTRGDALGSTSRGRCTSTTARVKKKGTCDKGNKKRKRGDKTSRETAITTQTHDQPHPRVLAGEVEVTDENLSTVSVVQNVARPRIPPTETESPHTIQSPDILSRTYNDDGYSRKQTQRLISLMK
jgi:hypothetical protein